MRAPVAEVGGIVEDGARRVTEKKGKHRGDGVSQRARRVYTQGASHDTYHRAAEDPQQRDPGERRSSD